MGKRLPKYYIVVELIVYKLILRLAALMEFRTMSIKAQLYTLYMCTAVL